VFYMDEEYIKREICRVMKSLYDRGLVTALSGNVSARLPNTEAFWITPSGLFKGGLKPQDLVKLDLNLNIIEGTNRPSIEAGLHAAIYKLRPDVNAIVHAHNPMATALATLGYELEPLSAEAELLVGQIKIIPYAPPGSKRLIKIIEQHVENNVNAFILVRHGVLGLGKTLVEAEEVVECLEDLAKMNVLKLLLKFLR